MVLAIVRAASLFGASFALVCGVGCSRADRLDKSDSGEDASGRAGSVTRLASCDRVATAGTCSEYAGAYLGDNETLLTSTCRNLGGVFAYAECPNTSIVGACTLSTGEVRKFYGSGAASFDAERARGECRTSLRGTWYAR